MFRKSMDVELIGVGFVSLVSFISIEYHRSRYTPRACAAAKIYRPGGTKPKTEGRGP